MTDDSDNIQLVRGAFEAFNRRDAEAICAVMDPEGELYPYAIEEARSKGYQGHEGLRQYLRDVDSVFRNFRLDLDHFSDAAEDVVYVRGRLHGTSHDGRAVDLPVGWLWTIRDGRLLRMQADPRGPQASGA